MVGLNPEVLKWAVQRSGLSDDRVVKDFPKFQQWLDGTWKPTVRQLQNFADKTHVAVSELFGSDLPDYALQIADFRTVGDAGASCPSPELFDTIDAMVSRQDWMKDYFASQGYPAVEFVGSFKGTEFTERAAEEISFVMHRLLRLDDAWGLSQKDMSQALKTLKDAIESLGVSVVVNGVVDDNTHRKLNVEEFRGFVLADSVAPLIFINGRDSKGAQIFTLVHELCHLALSGVSGVSNAPEDQDPDVAEERFCNIVAGCFLVPKPLLFDWWGRCLDSYDKVKNLARDCKVNFVVVARRARELGVLSSDEFFALWRRYKSEVPAAAGVAKGGGDYFRNKQYKLGSVFTDAVRAAVNTNYLSYRDAYDLTGLSAPSFKKYFEGVV